MNIRRFPGAVLATATLTVWLDSTVPVVAQVTSSPNVAPSTPAPVTEPVQLSGGVADILKLSRAKVNDDVTVAFIQNGDRRYSLTASEIVYLRQEGVSDRVLTAMLNQEPQSAPAPQQAAPATAPEASAPQHAAPPAPTTVAEAAPASTVYVPSTPTYYSFYDPSPYWYEPWPYWYTSPYWYGYPLFTFGFYWGNCGYGYWNHGYCYNGHWNNYWHDGNHHGAPHNGNHPNGNSAPHDGRSIPGGKTAMQASKGSPAGGVNQARPRSGPGPSARTAQSATQAGVSGNNHSQPAAPRASGNQVNAATSRSGQGTSPTSAWGSGANNRTAARDSIGNQGSTEFARSSQPAAPRTGTSQANVTSARGGQGAGPTRVWTGNAGQGPTSRGVATPSVPSVAGPSRVSASPTTVWNKSASQPASHPAVNIAGNYQRSSYSPSYGYRAGGNVTSIGRPSMSSSYGSMGNTSAFRSGGGFWGTRTPSMSSGGGFRGGGGGGFGSGGFSHGGGGGGRHR